MLSLPDKIPGKYFGISLVLFILLLFFMARLGPIGKEVVPFGLLYAASCVLLMAIYKAFPDDWPLRKQFILIFSIAILLRFFFIAFPASFDVNRYIWEGYVYNNGFNPYLHAPNDPVLKPLVNDIWHDINHKDISAAYPPMMILFFGIWTRSLFILD